jgi:molybdopterin synthase catalytic subunit
MTPVTDPPAANWVAVAPAPLSLDALIAWATRPECGAVVSFSGVVRDHSSAHEGVVALEYETSDELATGRIDEIVAEARRRFAGLGAIAIHHRTGRVELGEPTVLVVVSSAHRAEAFEAARYCIDTLKSSVPMWKREHFAGGSAWSDEGTPITDVERR